MTSIFKYLLGIKSKQSKSKYEYKKIKNGDVPKWILKKWKLLYRNYSSIDLENRKFYFKGKKYRYMIKTDMAGGLMGGTSSGFDVSPTYYKKCRKL